MKRYRLLLVLAPFAVVLGGCPDTGIICNSPDTRCGPGCANLTLDPAHCGACGAACGSGFICQNSQCLCDPMLGLSTCGQTCVDIRTSHANCGACGSACPADQLCESPSDGGATSCVSSCAPGRLACMGGCTDLTADRQNCGACGNACAQGIACIDGGCAVTLEAICFNSGQLYAVDAQAEVVGAMPASNPPYSPIGLAFHGVGQSVVADEQSNRLYTFGTASTGAFDLAATDGIGKGAQSVTVFGDRAYVVNSTDHTLDVIDLSQAPVTDGGSRRVCPAGTSCTASVLLPNNSYPQYVALDPGGGEAYVTLQGNTAGDAGDGGDDPNGNRVASINLQTLQLDLISTIPFDPAQGYQPRPQGIAIVGGRVFVALANLHDYTPMGHGEVDVFVEDGGSGSLELVQQHIDLGGGCLNAGAVLPVGGTLFVACGPKYASNFMSVEQPGALAGLNTALLTPAFTPEPFACMTDGGCQAGGALRMAYAAGKIFIGDSIDGRLFTADPATGNILRGPDNPLVVCPAAAGGLNFIADVAAP